MHFDPLRVGWTQVNSINVGAYHFGVQRMTTWLEIKWVGCWSTLSDALYTRLLLADITGFFFICLAIVATLNITLSPLSSQSRQVLVSFNCLLSFADGLKALWKGRVIWCQSLVLFSVCLHLVPVVVDTDLFVYVPLYISEGKQIFVAVHENFFCSQFLPFYCGANKASVYECMSMQLITNRVETKGTRDIINL